MTDTNELRAAAEEMMRTIVKHGDMEKNPIKRAKSNAIYEICRMYLAESEMDCTDASRPSYWRGNDDGVRGACEAITKILDGKDNGSGVCGEPLETLRRRLLGMA